MHPAVKRLRDAEERRDARERELEQLRHEATQLRAENKLLLGVISDFQIGREVKAARRKRQGREQGGSEHADRSA
jgi:hypothetical protein